MPVTKPIIEIVNVVASATIDQKLDLYKIQDKFPDVEYNPEQFPG
jgi:transcription initiation factor TFIID TATA-box-binding protein